MERHLKNNQGFTLIEVLVAMTLMTIAIFAVIGMQTVAMKADSTAQQLTVATSLGQQVLEDVLSWSSSDSRINPTPPSDGTFAYYPDPANPANNFITDRTAGRFTTTCTRTFGTSANGILQGTVRIIVTITYANNKTVTITGFKRLV
ncbi:MAG: prepilin-type N-terminal cleavage/methylation domain-containing protein [Geobacter sp.]|nr:MAG: prepilin-type N-terminal cleavage/methylation domain-containing protein [Geobacter sp.]